MIRVNTNLPSGSGEMGIKYMSIETIGRHAAPEDQPDASTSGRLSVAELLNREGYTASTNVGRHFAVEATHEAPAVAVTPAIDRLTPVRVGRRSLRERMAGLRDKLSNFRVRDNSGERRYGRRAALGGVVVGVAAVLAACGGSSEGDTQPETKIAEREFHDGNYTATELNDDFGKPDQSMNLTIAEGYTNQVKPAENQTFEEAGNDALYHDRNKAQEQTILATYETGSLDDTGAPAWAFVTVDSDGNPNEITAESTDPLEIMRKMSTVTDTIMNFPGNDQVALDDNNHNGSES